MHFMTEVINLALNKYFKSSRKTTLLVLPETFVMVTVAICTVLMMSFARLRVDWGVQVHTRLIKEGDA